MHRPRLKPMWSNINFVSYAIAITGSTESWFSQYCRLKAMKYLCNSLRVLFCWPPISSLVSLVRTAEAQSCQMSMMTLL